MVVEMMMMMMMYLFDQLHFDDERIHVAFYYDNYDDHRVYHPDDGRYIHNEYFYYSEYRRFYQFFVAAVVASYLRSVANYRCTIDLN